MDVFHERLARVALASVAGYGFCLAGGYAVQAHGMLERPSEDVDLFTTADAEAHFAQAVAIVVQAYVDDGLVVSTVINNPGFARLSVSEPITDVVSKVELGIDWRSHPPTILAIGPVLHADDAVANKVCALYSRAQTRDYIDVDAALRSGRYSGADLLRLAAEHDPGFDAPTFVQALRAVRRLPLAEFTAYRLSEHEVAELVERILAWADTISA